MSKEIAIDESETQRFVEFENDLAMTKIELAELEIRKFDVIESLKAKYTERLGFIAKLKKKYNFDQENFSIDIDNKKIKFL